MARLRTLALAALVGVCGLSSASPESLPPGVMRVALGRAVTTTQPSGGLICTIPDPLTSPFEFKGNVTEISYLVEVDPKKVRQVKVSVQGDLGSSETKSVNCNAYSICAGALCQTQFGNTLSRLDGKPLKQGTFTLKIDVDGQVAEIPFAIKEGTAHEVDAADEACWSGCEQCRALLAATWLVP